MALTGAHTVPAFGSTFVPSPLSSVAIRSKPSKRISVVAVPRHYLKPVLTVSSSGVLPHSPSPAYGSLQTQVAMRPQAMANVAAENLKEALPPSLDSTSKPPDLFDGTPRLYISYTCPFAQRTWIARNYKGLQDKIQLVPIDLKNRPAWYKEEVYPANKVPALEHNYQVKGESLDLLKYIDSEFEGPKLLPEDPEKQAFAEELLSFSSTFNSANFKAFSSKEDIELEIGDAYDRLEIMLGKYDDGPFFLGQFSEADIAYAPFIERFYPFCLHAKNYDITKGRPKLAQWIQALEKLDAYIQTKRDPQELLESLKQKFGVTTF